MTSWTPQTKNTASYSDQTKNSSSYSNQSKSASGVYYLLMANGSALLKANGGKIILAQSSLTYVPTYTFVTKN